MQLPIEIVFRGMSPSEAVEAMIREWAARLDGVFDRIMRCEVVVEAPHRHQRQGREFHVRIMLTVPGEQIVVSRDPGPDEAHEDVYVAVRDSFRAARRQLEDYVRMHVQGSVKAHEAPAHGRVSYLDVEREWGYIDTSDERRVYFHRNSVLGGIEGLELGEEVRFAEEAGERGPQASTVTRLGHRGHRELPT